ncbi:MAG: YabP/YqfC family sporulation protein [Lachnospiraceae bacterium]|nr:YabP/YqfC family sporulation protein [Lachnospiraceae bacterium]
MQVTSDVTEGVIILRVHGSKEAWLENFQSLQEYTAESIRVTGKSSGVWILGRNMRIEYYGAVEMKIIGEIQRIEYV